jgi:nucleotide-binding universal stress UspA family protein
VIGSRSSTNLVDKLLNKGEAVPTKVLVATDGSAAAWAAVEAGVELAAAEKASVILVHASPQIAEALFEASPYDQASNDMVMGADEALREGAELAQEKGVAFELQVIGEHGAKEVADAIVGIAAGEGADMIVVGSRGHGAAAAAVFGSVSLEVVRHAQVPVTVVHAHERPA